MFDLNTASLTFVAWEASVLCRGPRSDLRATSPNRSTLVKLQTRPDSPRAFHYSVQQAANTAQYATLHALSLVECDIFTDFNSNTSMLSILC